MKMKYVPPSVRETAFNCPHCGAFSHQRWYSTHAGTMKKDDPLPTIIDAARLDELKLQSTEKQLPDDLVRWAERMATGRPFVRPNQNRNFPQDVHNVWFSECYNCRDIALWIHDRLIYPQRGEVLPANPDLPPEIARDYDEAGAILDLSPRGAAALIRLAIQKLCRHLGQSGENINADIKALVADGLDLRVQKALDAVRVIGNNAVHPGQIDLRDDRATAESLFGLFNLIAEKTISEPRHVEEVYNTLPEGARKAIEKRDGWDDDTQK